jgi:hypothetical protein
MFSPFFIRKQFLVATMTRTTGKVSNLIAAIIQ